MVRVPLIFASLFRPHRLAWPRTLPFQGSNTGSNPVGDTREALNAFVIWEIQRFEPPGKCGSYTKWRFHGYNLSPSPPSIFLPSGYHSSSVAPLFQGSCAALAKSLDQ